MANLLTAEARKTLLRDARARFVLAASAMLLIVAGIAALSLVPSYAAIRSREGSVSASSMVSPTNASTSASMKQTQALVKKLFPLIAATSSPLGAIKAALSDRPTGIEVDHISLAGGTGSTIIITGVASGRDAINAYRSVLGADPHFTKVSVPVGALIGAEGGQFSVTLSGTF